MIMDNFSPIVNAVLGVGGLFSNAMSNRQNQLNFERQMEFAKYQYEDTKNFNSPQNQVKMLRAAGLNPALTFGNGVQGASAVSQPSPTPMNPLDMGALSSFGANFNQSTLLDSQRDNLLANTQKTNTENAGLSIDNQFKAAEHLSEIYHLDMDSMLKDTLREAAKVGIQFDRDSMKDRLWQQKMQSQYTQALAYGQFYVNQYVPEQQQAQIDQMLANSAMLMAVSKATPIQAHASLMNALTAKHAMESQYGWTPELRKQFSSAALKMLNQQYFESLSKEFSNFNPSQKTYNPISHSYKWYNELNKNHNRFGSY